MSGVWLVRHGAVSADPLRRMVGTQDIPLSKAGRAQVRKLAVSFMPLLRHGLGAVITSDLERCRNTASLLLEGWTPHPPVHADADLREICLGQWQGLSRADIASRWPGAHEARGLDMASFVPPGGESFRMVQRRALHAVARWRQRYEGALLLVTHAGVMRALLAHWLALPLADVLRIPVRYACHCFLPGWQDGA